MGRAESGGAVCVYRGGWGGEWVRCLCVLYGAESGCDICVYGGGECCDVCVRVRGQRIRATVNLRVILQLLQLFFNRFLIVS